MNPCSPDMLRSAEREDAVVFGLCHLFHYLVVTLFMPSCPSYARRPRRISSCSVTPESAPARFPGKEGAPDDDGGRGADLWRLAFLHGLFRHQHGSAAPAAELRADGPSGVD